MAADYRELGYFIATRRVELQHRQRYLARCCGMSRSWVSMLEKGRIRNLPDPDILEMLTNVLLVAPTELLKAAVCSLRIEVHHPEVVPISGRESAEILGAMKRHEAAEAATAARLSLQTWTRL